MPHARYSSQEIAERGRQLYEHSIRSEVEADHAGEFLVIDVESGDYELDVDHLAASNRAAAKHQGAPLYALRIGFPAAGRIGGRRATIKPLAGSS